MVLIKTLNLCIEIKLYSEDLSDNYETLMEWVALIAVWCMLVT